jgi:hypothetical protein
MHRRRAPRRLPRTSISASRLGYFSPSVFRILHYSCAIVYAQNRLELALDVVHRLFGARQFTGKAVRVRASRSILPLVRV